MDSVRKPKSFWSALFGRSQKSVPVTETVVSPAEARAEIQVPVEQRKVLEEAIPFRRPPDQSSATDGTQFIFGPLEPSDAPAAGPRTKAPAAPVESYRKKYKKYGRDVCLPGEEGEPYDVLMDNPDNSRRGVDGVSPL
jgi:hypothetical protein